MKKILAVTVTMIMIISCMITNVYAATTYTGEGSETIYVTTYNSWSKPTITFQQKKLTATLKSLLKGKTKSNKVYGKYNTTVKNLTSGKTEYSGLKGAWSTASKTFTLNKNSSYEIIVEYDSQQTGFSAQKFGYSTNSISAALWTAKGKNAEISN